MKKFICTFGTIVCLIGMLALGGCSLEHTPIDANSGATPGSQPAKTPSPSPVATVSPSATPDAAVTPSAVPNVPHTTPNEGKKLLKASGYVTAVDGNIVYVDLENPGERNYPDEGNDRAVAFDMSNAKIEQTPAYPGDALRADPVRRSVTVDITYYVENGKNIVTVIHSDNVEKPVIPH